MPKIRRQAPVVHFEIYDELPQFNLIQAVQDNLAEYIYIVPPAEDDEVALEKKINILHMREADYLAQQELWWEDRIPDLAPNPVDLLANMRQRPNPAAEVINPPAIIPDPWWDAGPIFLDQQPVLDRRINHYVQAIYEQQINYQINLAPLGAIGAIDNGDNRDHYEVVRVPVMLDLDLIHEAPDRPNHMEIDVHVRPGGLPCLCVECVRERNEVAALDHALVDKFRAKVIRRDSRPPTCDCGACDIGGVGYTRNGLEGCLRPNDEGYAEREARAAGLLQEMLTESQWDCWQNNDYFSVMGSNATVYRVYRVPTYNVLNTQTMQWLCTLPRTERWGGSGDIVPPSDGRIAQMLLIMTNAARFEEVANHHAECMHPHGWVPPDLVTPNSARRYGARLTDTRGIYRYNNGYGQRLG